MKMEANISSYDDIWLQQTKDAKKTAYEYYLTTNFIYKVLMGQSDVAGWGIFLQGIGITSRLKDRGHMVILDEASGAPDPVPISTLAGACAFTDRWSLNELAYGVPSNGPYQTNPPSLDDIILSIRIDREGQVRRVHHEEEIDGVLGTMFSRVCAICFIVSYTLKSSILPITWKNKWSGENPKLHKDSYALYGRVMNPLAAQLEQKPRKDHGTIRGRHSTSSSTFNEPSSSHLNDDDDDDDDGNNEGTSRASTLSPIRYVNSLTNKVPQVFQNPPNIDPHLEHFYTCQTKIINRQVQIRDEHRGGLRSIEKGFRNLWSNLKKKLAMWKISI
ncbi:hypothetical protein Tco_0473140 [Tanacetum coccineum]